MKKIVLILLALLSITVTFAYADMNTTYTEQYINKWSAPLVQKEKNFRAKQDAAMKAQQAQQAQLDAMRKAREDKLNAYKTAQEKRQQDFEAAKKARKDTLNQTKKDVKSLFKF